MGIRRRRGALARRITANAEEAIDIASEIDGEISGKSLIGLNRLSRLGYLKRGIRKLAALWAWR